MTRPSKRLMLTIAAILVGISVLLNSGFVAMVNYDLQLFLTHDCPLWQADESCTMEEQGLAPIGFFWFLRLPLPE